MQDITFLQAAPQLCYGYQHAAEASCAGPGAQLSDDSRASTLSEEGLCCSIGDRKGSPMSTLMYDRAHSAPLSMATLRLGSVVLDGDECPQLNSVRPAPAPLGLLSPLGGMLGWAGCIDCPFPAVLELDRFGPLLHAGWFFGLPVPRMGRKTPPAAPAAAFWRPGGGGGSGSPVPASLRGHASAPAGTQHGAPSPFAPAARQAAARRPQPPGQGAHGRGAHQAPRLPPALAAGHAGRHLRTCPTSPCPTGTAPCLQAAVILTMHHRGEKGSPPLPAAQNRPHPRAPPRPRCTYAPPPLQVGRGQRLGEPGGGGGPFPDMTVEDLLEVVRRLPPEASAVRAISQGLYYLDPGALAALLKELNKSGHTRRAQVRGRVGWGVWRGVCGVRRRRGMTAAAPGWAGPSGCCWQGSGGGGHKAGGAALAGGACRPSPHARPALPACMRDTNAGGVRPTLSTCMARAGGV